MYNIFVQHMQFVWIVYYTRFHFVCITENGRNSKTMRLQKLYGLQVGANFSPLCSFALIGTSSIIMQQQDHLPACSARKRIWEMRATATTPLIIFLNQRGLRGGQIWNVHAEKWRLLSACEISLLVTLREREKRRGTEMHALLRCDCLLHI